MTSNASSANNHNYPRSTAFQESINAIPRDPIKKGLTTVNMQSQQMKQKETANLNSTGTYNSPLLTSHHLQATLHMDSAAMYG